MWLIAAMGFGVGVIIGSGLVIGLALLFEEGDR